MKKRMAAIVFATVMVLGFAGYAESKSDFYIGLGGSYAVENFNEDEMGGGQSLQSLGYNDLDYGNTSGVNAKIGYSVNENLAIQFDFDYLSGFDWNDTISVSGTPFEFSSDIDITAYTLSARFIPFKFKDNVLPFLIAGIGMMDAEANVEASYAFLSASSSDSESDMCAKIGLGAAFFVNEKFSIDAEGSYFKGLGDLDNISFTKATLAGVLHF